MLLTQFELLKGLEESKPPKKEGCYPLNITQRQRARAHKFFHEQLEVGDMQINVMPPWTHLQRGDSSLPSYTKDSSGYTPYVDKGKIFGLTHNSQAVVIFVGEKKDAPTNISSFSGSRPQAFNSVGIMTRSQLAASSRTPRTPLRGLPTTGRGPVAYPVMFHLHIGLSR